MDGGARLYNQVVIKSLQTSQVKDQADAVSFQMTLKEINVMEITDQIEVQAFANLKITLPPVGTSIGQAATMGTVTSNPISLIL
jgi:hypothetical protein